MEKELLTNANIQLMNYTFLWFSHLKQPEQILLSCSNISKYKPIHSGGWNLFNTIKQWVSKYFSGGVCEVKAKQQEVDHNIPHLQMLIPLDPAS